MTKSKDLNMEGMFIDDAPQPTFETNEFIEETKWVETPKSDKVTVRLVNKNEVEGRYAVEHVSTHKVRLVEKDKVLYTLGEQDMDGEAFENGVEPYDWTEEISSFSVTEDEIRQTLYQAGLFEKQPLTRRELVNTLLSRGIVPLQK